MGNIDSPERDYIDDKGSEKGREKERSFADKNRSHNVLISSATSESAEKPGEASKFARQINNKQRADLRVGFGAEKENNNQDDEENKNYSYLILTSELDSNNFNKFNIVSLDPEKLPVNTFPVNVSLAVAAIASTTSPSSVSFNPNLTDITIMNNKSNLDYLNISMLNKKCFIKKWKYFWELNGNEKVLTLNQKTSEKEWQKPLEKQEFEHNEEMYSVKTIDSKGKEGELVVSPEYKRYVGNNNHISLSKNILSNSSVVNTGTNDCCFKCGSFDQIAEFVSNASARYGESLGSDKFLIAFSNNSSYSDSFRKSIDLSISSCLISNSCSESLDFSKHSSLCLLNSDLMNSGAINSALIDVNKYAEVDLGFIIENKAVLSNISSILTYLYSSLFSGDIAFNNFSLFFGGSLNNNSLKDSFFALLPNSTDHLRSSCSSLELNLSIIFCFNISRLISSINNLDKSNLNCSACSCSSSGIDTHNSAILTSNEDNLDLNNFRLEKISENSERDCIDNEGSEKGREKERSFADKNRSQNVTKCFIKNGSFFGN